MAVNKVEFFGATLIDLTGDTVSSDTLAKGITAHDKSGTKITGTMEASLPDGYATGSISLSSNVTGNANTKICTISDIGFTPTKFLFFYDGYVGTQYYVHSSIFMQFGSTYVRQTATRNRSSWSGTTAATSWTTQTSGYLYLSSNTVYFRSSSSYILSKGTWRWVAIK